MLVVVVVIFATLWLPYRGMLVYNSFATMYSKASFMDLWFLMFAKTCVYINRYIHLVPFPRPLKKDPPRGRWISCIMLIPFSSHAAPSTRSCTRPCLSNSGGPFSGFSFAEFTVSSSPRGKFSPSIGIDVIWTVFFFLRLRLALIRKSSIPVGRDSSPSESIYSTALRRLLLYGSI